MSSWSGASSASGGHVHDPGQHLGHEAAADDGAGLGDLLGLGRPMAEARQHGVLDGVRHRRLADREAVGPGIGTQRAEQLLDVERDAIGALVDRLDDLAWSRQPRIEDQRRDERRLGPRQRRQAHLLGDPLGQEASAPVAQVDVERLVGAVAAAEHDRPVAGPAGQLGDDLEAQVVRPLQVLEQEQHLLRQRREDLVDDVHHELATSAHVVGVDHVVAKREELAAQVGEARHAQHAARHIEDRRRRDVVVLWRHEPTDRDEAPILGLLADRVEEPRLADPGLAGDQQELAVT